MSKTIQAGKTILTFGKYKGLSILAVDRLGSEGRSYLHWIGRTFEDCSERKAVLEYLRVKTARERNNPQDNRPAKKSKKKGKKAKRTRDESVPWKTMSYGWVGGKAPEPRPATGDLTPPFQPGIFTMGVQRDDLAPSDLMDPDVTDRLAAVELPEHYFDLNPNHERDQMDHLSAIARSHAAV